MSDKLKQSWQEYLMYAFGVIALICGVLYIIPSASHGEFPGWPLLIECFVFIGFALIHGGIRYGIKGILFLLGVVLVISFIFENLSVLVGFPFGHYHYTMMSSTTLWNVPVLVNFVYFGAGYVSWVVANAILGGVDRNPKSNYSRFALPVTAAFVMCMWDVCMDTTAATVKHAWVWENGGGFFGTPLSNYLGWFLCVWCFYQLFALYLGWRKEPVITEGSLVESKSFYIPAIMIYIAMGIQYVFTFFAVKIADETALRLIDQAGQAWSKGNLYETSVVMFVFTMLAISVIAFIRVFQHHGPSSEKALSEA